MVGEIRSIERQANGERKAEMNLLLLFSHFRFLGRGLAFLGRLVLELLQAVLVLQELHLGRGRAGGGGWGPTCLTCLRLAEKSILPPLGVPCIFLNLD